MKAISTSLTFKQYIYIFVCFFTREKHPVFFSYKARLTFQTPSLTIFHETWMLRLDFLVFF